MDFLETSLGRTKKGREVCLYPDTRSRHVHVIGASGKGKSKFIEHLIRNDIADDNGLCLIDPHGYLYNDLVEWCTEKGMLDRGKLNKKIILFDPSDAKWTFGFNPLPADDKNMFYYIQETINAVAKVWGAEDTTKTPTLERCLMRVLNCLAQHRLPLLESRYLITKAKSKIPIRKYLTENISDGGTKDDWEYFNSLNPKAFEDYFLSTINRLGRFIEDPSIEMIIGQTEKTLNARNIMDDGNIFLVNLGTVKNDWEEGFKITRSELRLLGTLLVNEFFLRALERPKNSRPFYLYIDECSLFLNKNIEYILTEGRKFGLHLILAHQTLGQLKDAGEAVYKGVMGGAQTKVIFGGLPTEEAKDMAEEVMKFNYQEPKKKLIKPTVVGQEKTLLRSYSKNIGKNWGGNEGFSDSEGGGSAHTIVEKGDGPTTLTTTQQTSRSSVKVKTESESENWSVAEALMSVFEDRATAVYSLDEQIHRAANFLKAQKTQHAIIKIPEKNTIVVKTPTIEDVCCFPGEVKRFKEKAYKLTEFAHEREKIEQQIKERTKKLEREARKYKDQLRKSRERKDPDSFRG